MVLLQPLYGFGFVVDGIAQHGKLRIAVLGQPLQRLNVGMDGFGKGFQLGESVLHQKLAELLVALQTHVEGDENLGVVIG